MRIGAPQPQETRVTAPEHASTAPAPSKPEQPPFSALLQRQLAEPRARIEEARSEVRGAIEQIRGGGVLAISGVLAIIGAGAPSAASGLANTSVDVAAYSRLAATGGPDPFGWREMTRRVGDDLVAPGFGALFERQIQQESGFDPEVTFGLRKSSAGAEGIAQLMPQYYQGVDRTDPQASLTAAAQTMRHNLAATDGDVRKAMAAYNAGLGRVQALVNAHGEQWERGLPAETKQYLAAILGRGAPQVAPSSGGEAAVFGGRGPHGVMTSPLDQVQGKQRAGTSLDLLGTPGAAVRAPADGRITSVTRLDGVATLLIDHGNGWRSSLRGLDGVTSSEGATVHRGDSIGALPARGANPLLRLGVSLESRALNPEQYLLGA